MEMKVEQTEKAWNLKNLPKKTYLLFEILFFSQSK